MKCGAKRERRTERSIQRTGKPRMLTTNVNIYSLPSHVFHLKLFLSVKNNSLTNNTGRLHARSKSKLNKLIYVSFFLVVAKDPETCFYDSSLTISITSEHFPCRLFKELREDFKSSHGFSGCSFWEEHKKFDSCRLTDSFYEFSIDVLWGLVADHGTACLTKRTNSAHRNPTWMINFSSKTS